MDKRQWRRMRMWRRSFSLTIWRRKRAKSRERETTATRPYRALLPPNRALHILRRGSGEECVCGEKRAKSRERETTAFSAYRALLPPIRERLLPLLHVAPLLRVFSLQIVLFTFGKEAVEKGVYVEKSTHLGKNA